MSFTARDVELRARDILKDRDEESATYGPDAMRRYLADGVNEVYALRPDTLASASGSVNAELASVDAGTSIPLEMKWRAALTDYVVGRCLETDGADKKHAKKSGEFRKQWAERIMSL